MNLYKLGKAIHEQGILLGVTERDQKSWKEGDGIPADLAKIHGEISGALLSFELNNQELFGEEMAQAVIRIIGLTHGLGIDLELVIASKMMQEKGKL